MIGRLPASSSPPLNRTGVLACNPSLLYFLPPLRRRSPFLSLCSVSPTIEAPSSSACSPPSSSPWSPLAARYLRRHRRVCHTRVFDRALYVPVLARMLPVPAASTRIHRPRHQLIGPLRSSPCSWPYPSSSRRWPSSASRLRTHELLHHCAMVHASGRPSS
jgi:hypothetical protein